MQRGFYINLLDLLSSWYSAQTQVNSTSKKRHDVALRYTAFKHVFYKVEVLCSSPRYSAVLFCTCDSVIFLVAKCLIKSSSTALFSQRCSTAVIYTGVDLKKLRRLLRTLDVQQLLKTALYGCRWKATMQTSFNVLVFYMYRITWNILLQTNKKHLQETYFLELCITGWVWVHYFAA